jgi:hypothetical protein
MSASVYCTVNEYEPALNAPKLAADIASVTDAVYLRRGPEPATEPV